MLNPDTAWESDFAALTVKVNARYPRESGSKKPASFDAGSEPPVPDRLLERFRETSL